MVIGDGLGTESCGKGERGGGGGVDFRRSTGCFL